MIDRLELETGEGEKVIVMTVGPLVFFDIDNTLIQSSSGHMEAMLLSIGEVYGLEASIEVKPEDSF